MNERDMRKFSDVQRITKGYDNDARGKSEKGSNYTIRDEKGEPVPVEAIVVRRQMEYFEAFE